MLHVFVDADACPVKNEVYRVARRYNLEVTLVANSWMRIPLEEGFKLVVVEGDLDAADRWIAATAGPGDIVITADVPLAARCVERGAGVLGPTGREFTTGNVGEALATRDLLNDLRESRTVRGGPPPFGKEDRSRFLQTLDTLVQRIRRGTGAGS